MRFAWAGAALTMLALAGCGSNPAAPEPGRSGSSADRVSPVRAAEINTRLGVGYLERGQVEIAMEKLEMAVRQDPDHAPAHVALGVVYQSIERTEDALVHLRRAVRLAPGDGSAHNTYAALLCRVGRYADADREFRAALQDPFYATPQVVLANAGSCARRAGDVDQAEEYLRLALEFDPVNQSALFNLAEISWDQGRALQARAFLQRLESAGMMDPDALLLAIRVENELGSPADAEHYEKILFERYPQSPQASQMRQQN
ncbi:MAG: type IV pilus biogenesis/stability protein PilW [Wenzhouxiangellaceae bacterium]